MKNLKLNIFLLLCSIFLIITLVSCKDEISPSERDKINKEFKKKVLARINEDANANLNDLSLDKVTSLEGLFKNKNFTGDISGWDVSKITNFKSMFEGSTFNGNISSWTPTAAQNMQFMFKDNEAFNQNLSSWKIDENKTLFASIFKGATNMLGEMDSKRNSPKATDKMPSVIKDRYNKMKKPSDNTIVTLKALINAEILDNGNKANYNYIDTSDTVSFESLFANKTEFNGKINDWDTKSVTNMKGVFSNATSFNSEIEQWDVSNVSTMQYMFYRANSFNKPIGKWNTRSLMNTDVMFSETKAFNQDINDWDTSNVIGMSYMFYKAEAFNKPIGKWDILKVTNIEYLFYQAISFNQDLNAWNDKFNDTLVQSLKNSSYKEGIFKEATSMLEENKPEKLRK